MILMMYIIKVKNLIKDLNKKSNKFGLWITNKIGSIYFFFIIFIWTSIWLIWNTILPKKDQFDPSPYFQIWLFISNMVQIFLMPLIMIGQSMQNKRYEKKLEDDLKLDKKTSIEIEKLHHKIDILTEEIKRLKS